MSCYTKKIPAAVALVACFLLPMPLHADWTFFQSLFPDSSKQKPEAVSAPQTVEKSPSAATAPQGQEKRPLAGAADRPVPAPVRGTSGGNVTLPPLVPISRTVAPFSPTMTLHSQLLSVDSEWRGAVLVDGGITIAPAATLTIHPGTIVRFANGAGLHVLGRIVIQGSAANPVRLTSLFREPQDSDWGGIILSGSEKRNLLEHAVIEGAETAIFARFSNLTTRHVVIGNASIAYRLQSALATIAHGEITAAVTAVAAARSDLFIEKTRVSGGQSGIIATASAVEARDLAVSSCRLTALVAADSQLQLEKCSLTACQSALQLNRSTGEVRDSSFSDNRETGVIIAASHLRFTGNRLNNNRVGLQLDDNLTALWGNVISGNSSYNLIYLGDESLFAGGNRFGSSATTEFDNKIFSKRPGAVQLVPVFANEW